MAVTARRSSARYSPLPEFPNVASYVELTLVVLKNGRGIERQIHIIADKWEFSKFHLSSTTDGYGPVKRWCACARFPLVCARCSPGHTRDANVAAEQADPPFWAGRVGGPPRACHLHRRRESGFPVGPTTRLAALLSPEDEPADL